MLQSGASVPFLDSYSSNIDIASTTHGKYQFAS
jgi:hypothetical protein